VKLISQVKVLDFWTKLTWSCLEWIAATQVEVSQHSTKHFILCFQGVSLFQ
jgi:hypothetical protein